MMTTEKKAQGGDSSRFVKSLPGSLRTLKSERTSESLYFVTLLIRENDDWLLELVEESREEAEVVPLLAHCSMSMNGMLAGSRGRVSLK
jgi:hypothetical protein